MSVPSEINIGSISSDVDKYTAINVPNVITLAAGRCGFSESCLFIYGKQKVISPYGALMFTGLKCYKDKIPAKYTQYFINIFKDALKEDIISEEVYNTLVSTGKSIMITEKETIIE